MNTPDFERGYKWARNAFRIEGLTMEAIEAYAYTQEDEFDKGIQQFLRDEREPV